MSLAADLRARMAAGRVHGLFAKLADRAVVDLARQHAFDFLVVDREHSQLSEATALALVAHGAAIGLPVIVRLPELDRGQINRALEAGAAGIQLSSVRSPDEVRALRSSCEYAPGGTRSISLGHPGGDYGAKPLAEYLAQRTGAALLVAQIESALPAATYAAIVAERPDVAFIGTSDLLVDCGLDADRSAACVEQIAAAAREAGVVLGAFGLAERDDVRYLITDTDVSLLSAAMRASAPNHHPQEGQA